MPRPSKGESRKAFISRCIPHLVEKEGHSQKHAVGKCFGIWKYEKYRKNRGRIGGTIDERED